MTLFFDLKPNFGLIKFYNKKLQKYSSTQKKNFLFYLLLKNTQKFFVLRRTVEISWNNLKKFKFFSTAISII